MQPFQIPLSLEIWTERAKKHLGLVTPYTDAFVKRRDARLKHAVHDFLFVYYTFSPLKLKQWFPSFEEALEVNQKIFEEYPWLHHPYFSHFEKFLGLNPKNVTKQIFRLLEFIENLSLNILQRSPRFGCYGLHEWAMVYKLSPEAIRHNGLRLRLHPKEIAIFLEEQSICCSHYDAYRFFTKEAKPLNVVTPSYDTRLEMEQGGCLHANMDLYKWATKLWPWIGSDFIAKTFLHALKGRELDMRASPYDLTEEGYEPICIETEEGRKTYQREQQKIAEMAIPLRERLAAFCKKLKQCIPPQFQLPPKALYNET